MPLYGQGHEAESSSVNINRLYQPWSCHVLGEFSLPLTRTNVWLEQTYEFCPWSPCSEACSWEVHLPTLTFLDFCIFKYFPSFQKCNTELAAELCLEISDLLRSELSNDCLDWEACTILLPVIDLSTETEEFLSKTDGPHTIGFAATDGVPGGLFIYHEHSSNDVFEKGQCHLRAAATCARDQTH